MAILISHFFHSTTFFYPTHRNKEVASKEHVEDVRRSILGMSEFMQVIAGSQRYLQRKLDRHHATMVRGCMRCAWVRAVCAGVCCAVCDTHGTWSPLQRSFLCTCSINGPAPILQGLEGMQALFTAP